MASESLMTCASPQSFSSDSSGSMCTDHSPDAMFHQFEEQPRVPASSFTAAYAEAAAAAAHNFYLLYGIHLVPNEHNQLVPLDHTHPAFAAIHTMPMISMMMPMVTSSSISMQTMPSSGSFSSEQDDIADVAFAEMSYTDLATATTLRSLASRPTGLETIPEEVEEEETDSSKEAGESRGFQLENTIFPSEFTMLLESHSTALNIVPDRDPTNLPSIEPSTQECNSPLVTRKTQGKLARRVFGHIGNLIRSNSFEALKRKKKASS